MKFAAVFVLIAFVCAIEGGSIRPVERPLERPERPLEIPIKPVVPPLKSADSRPRPEDRVKIEDVPLLRPRPIEDVPLLRPRPIEDVPLLRPIANANSPVGY